MMDKKFHCHDCNAYGTIDAQGHYSEDEKATILRAYRERASMRGAERIFGAARQTLARWILEEAAKLPDWADTWKMHDRIWNNTLRQRLARFVRKTLSFSKSEVYPEAALKLYLHYYNTEWCPIS